MGTKRGIILNKMGKTLFWIFAIGLGFVNPLITFGLIILYFVPKIIQDLGQMDKEEQVSPKMNSFSKDTLENMK